MLYRISIVLFLAFHCQSIVFFKKHQQGWLFLNRTKSDPFLPLLSLEQEVKMQSTNSLPFVGEDISFFMTNGGVFMNGSIQSVSSQGTDISVYSGSLQLGSIDVFC